MALKFGFPSIDTFLDSLDDREFQEWIIYDRVEPLNHQAHMLGLITFMLANYFGVEDTDSMRKICLPWEHTDDCDTGDIVKTLQAKFPGAKNANPRASEGTFDV